MRAIFILTFSILSISGISSASGEPKLPDKPAPDSAVARPSSVLLQTPPSAKPPLSFYEETFPDPESLEKGAAWVAGTASTTWVARNLAEEKDTAKFLKGITGSPAFVEKRTPLIHKVFKSRIVGRAIFGIGAASSFYKLFRLYKVYRGPNIRDSGILPAERMSTKTIQRLQLDEGKR